MAAVGDINTVAPTHCDHCKKASSPNLKIRACTRCYAVGYCSKNCQRAEWRKHKLACKPRINANNKTKPSFSSQEAADQEDVIDVNSDAVRLETQNDNGTWQDVGPINLLNNMNAQHVHTNSSSSKRRKELSPATKQILGHTANSFIYRHSHDGIDENLVIFLHGAGDNHVPFDKLGQTMKLPQTATLSLSASMKMNLPDSSSSKSNSNSTFVELPFGLGYTWFEEMDYQVTGDVRPVDHPRRLQSLGHAVSAMNMLLSSLTDHNNNDKTTYYWIPERIFLFGFSAGACLAMETCRLWKIRCHVPLGGAICIGGGIKTDSLPRCVPVNNNKFSDEQHQFTDVLIVTGSKDDIYSQIDALKSKSCYDRSKVQIHVQQGKKHGMIGSREEMQAVMKFLSNRLVRRMPSMEDMSEK